MDINELSQIIINTINHLLNNDKYLFEHNISERCIAHRLALYLESTFHPLGFFVDAEYDGNINNLSGKKSLQNLNYSSNGINYTKNDVIPDIIIHKRGQNGRDNNLLIIELKKKRGRNKDRDRRKLKLFTSNQFGNNYCYNFGLFIILNMGNKPGFSIEWFENGNKLLI
jgi:hypothetical protein